MIQKKCETCAFWRNPGEVWDMACCTISMGIDCYHNNDQPWKHWEEIEDFLSEEEMTIC